jgi:4-hydroxyphenylpyruvate dioxygenase-like putative hemolysin
MIIVNHFLHDFYVRYFTALLYFETACTQGDIRLVAGSASNEGRVEICNQNQWGSVCDMGWDLTDARVACRHAGYSGDTSSKTKIACMRLFSVIVL